jgi:hypothetical protein
LCGASLVLLLAAIGWRVSGSLAGILVSDRNLMSLSRFQTAAWTVTVIAAYTAMVFIRIRSGEPDPLAVGIDWHLWAVMGISYVSLIGSPLLLDAKTQRAPTQAAMERAEKDLQQPASDIARDRRGLLYANPSPRDARFEDIFEGDEVGNTARVDIAKVQMFLFTMAALFTYWVSVGQALVHVTAAPSALPAVSEGFIALLALSHTGYLTSKGLTVPDTK